MNNNDEDPNKDKKELEDLARKYKKPVAIVKPLGMGGETILIFNNNKSANTETDDQHVVSTPSGSSMTLSEFKKRNRLDSDSASTSSNINATVAGNMRHLGNVDVANTLPVIGQASSAVPTFAANQAANSQTTIVPVARVLPRRNVGITTSNMVITVAGNMRRLDTMDVANTLPAIGQASSAVPTAAANQAANSQTTSVPVARSLPPRNVGITINMVTTVAGNMSRLDTMGVANTLPAIGQASNVVPTAAANQAANSQTTSVPVARVLPRRNVGITSNMVTTEAGSMFHFGIMGVLNTLRAIGQASNDVPTAAANQAANSQTTTVPVARSLPPRNVGITINMVTTVAGNMRRLDTMGVANTLPGIGQASNVVSTVAANQVTNPQTTTTLPLSGILPRQSIGSVESPCILAQRQTATTATKTTTLRSSVQQTSHNNYVIHSQLVLNNRIGRQTAERDRYSAKMLIILASGEQRLITFTLPRESCTVQDLLEQVSVPFDNSTTIQCVENRGANVEFFVTVGFSVKVSASELTLRAEESLQLRRQQEQTAPTCGNGGNLSSAITGPVAPGTIATGSAVTVATATSNGGTIVLNAAQQAVAAATAPSNGGTSSVIAGNATPVACASESDDNTNLEPNND